MYMYCVCVYSPCTVCTFMYIVHIDVTYMNSYVLDLLGDLKFQHTQCGKEQPTEKVSGGSVCSIVSPFCGHYIDLCSRSRDEVSDHVVCRLITR